MDGHEGLEAAGPLAELAESRVGVHPHRLGVELLRERLLVDAKQVEQEGDGPGLESQRLGARARLRRHRLGPGRFADSQELTDDVEQRQIGHRRAEGHTLGFDIGNRPVGEALAALRRELGGRR